MAKHDKLTLTIAKPDQLKDFSLLKYGSSERGKIVDVAVIDIDGTPYDLSNLQIFFIEELYNGEIILDSGNEDSSGAFSNTDLKQGKFSYQFQKNIYQYDGWAHFRFTKDEKTVDTTEGFAIKIIQDIDSQLDEASYIAYFEKIQKEHQNWIARAEDLIGQQQKLNADNKQLNLDTKQDVANMKAELQQNYYNKTEINSKTDTLQANINKKADSTALENYYTKSDIDTQKQQLQASINTNTTDLTDTRRDVQNVNTRVTTLEDKIKLEGFSSDAEAAQWARDHHGITYFED